MSKHPIIIVGAGIVGLSAALHLQRDGHRVTVIDGKGPGEGASKGNAAVIATESCIPVATPGILWDVPRYLLDPLGPLSIRWPYLPRLVPWLLRFLAASRPARVEEISIALGAILSRALDAHRDLAEHIGEKDMLRETGWLAIFEQEKRFQDYQWDLALQRRRGIPFRVLAAEEIRQFEPALAPIYAHAVYYPQNSFVTDNYRLVLAMAGKFRAEGGTILQQQVTGFEIGAEGPTHVLAEGGGRHVCSCVVIAAGAWSKNLTASLGHKVPLDTERGYHVTLPRPGKMPRLPIYSGDHSFAITPLEIGLRFAGTVELGGLEAPPDYRRAEKLMIHARRMFGPMNEEGRSDWMGFRPSMPDSLPVISQGRRFANTFFAYGHGHLGLTLGPLTGKLIADLVAGRPSGFDLGPYRIDRF